MVEVRGEVGVVGFEVVAAVLGGEEAEEGLLPKEELGEVGRVVRLGVDRLTLRLRVAAGSKKKEKGQFRRESSRMETEKWGKDTHSSLLA